jgi:hypothetical protein
VDPKSPGWVRLAVLLALACIVAMLFTALFFAILVAGQHGDDFGPYLRVWVQNESEQRFIVALHSESDRDLPSEWFVVDPHSSGWAINTGGPKWKATVWDGTCKNVVFERQFEGDVTDGVLVDPGGALKDGVLPSVIPDYAVSLPRTVSCSFRLLSASP